MRRNSKRIRDVAAEPRPEPFGGCAADASALLWLLPALGRLDRMLAAAAAMVPDVFGGEAAGRGFRGLYVGATDVVRMLQTAPGAPLFTTALDSPDPASDMASTDARLRELTRSYGLTPFDIDVVLIALAPDVDLRYERLYGYLQDDVTRRRPTVDLALNLLCGSVEEKLARQAHFGSTAPLVAGGLIRLVADPAHTDPSLLAHYLRLDEQIISFLVGRDSLDRRLADFSHWCDNRELQTDGLANGEVLARLAREAASLPTPLTLLFEGEPGTGRRKAAAEYARHAGRPLLVADLARALVAPVEWSSLVRLLLREASLRRGILYLDGIDALRAKERSNEYDELLTGLSGHQGVTILAGTLPWLPVARAPLAVVTLRFPSPSFGARRASWRASVVAAGMSVSDADLDGLAQRFRLSYSQIHTAAIAARDGERLSGGTANRDHRRALFAAARAQSGHELAALTQRIEPRSTWADLVLPEDAIQQLREIAAREAARHRVFGDWGFDQKLSTGKGSAALFAGPSGTGKTMAAEVIANELGFDLYRIDLASVVSKYIGETEKNLDRIFRAAEQANGILFFDEADALFGKRSEVRDSHDRYANIEISYLLQKMEQYEGLAILATNLRQHLDEAFLRRLAFTIHFPFPDQASRRRIWTGIWPAETPRAKDVDLDALAAQFKLSGGNIKNIALAAAFLAASDGGRVTMAHLGLAVRREYQKLGKTLSAVESYPNFAMTDQVIR